MGVIQPNNFFYQAMQQDFNWRYLQKQEMKGWVL